MSRRLTRTGWLPNQHGAWAILVVPVAVGMVERSRTGGLPGWAWPLLACWLVGYFAFFAAGLWLKAPARRRHAFVRPMVTYGAVSAVAGAVALAWQGGTLAWWAVVFAPLVAASAWLTAHRRERDLASGVLTVTASALMLPVMRFTTPDAALARGLDWDGLVTVLIWAYFVGTVLYVKTMIRERGHRSWWLASTGWHTACLVAGAMVALAHPASPWWLVTFAVALGRAAGVPWLATARGRRISPQQIGVAEIAIVMLVVLSALLVPRA